MTKQYEYNKTWRIKHPHKRNNGNLRYYRKTQGARNSNTRWTKEEIEMILEHSITDNELSELLGRSVRAIQVKRSKSKSIN